MFPRLPVECPKQAFHEMFHNFIIFAAPVPTFLKHVAGFKFRMNVYLHKTIKLISLKIKYVVFVLYSGIRPTCSMYVQLRHIISHSSFLQTRLHQSLQSNSAENIVTWSPGSKHKWMTRKQTLTFLVQALLLVENNEFAVLVGLLQDVLALLDVAVVVFQTKEGGHQGHVGLNAERMEANYKNMTIKHFQI